MTSSRLYRPVLLLVSSFAVFAIIVVSAHAADALPWTKPVGYLGFTGNSYVTLSSQCTSQGGTATRICFKKSDGTYKAWTSYGCAWGTTDAVWCKAPATAKTNTTTTTTTVKPAAATAPATTATAPVKTNTIVAPATTNTTAAPVPTNTTLAPVKTNTTAGTGACGEEPGTLKNPLKFCNLSDLVTGILTAVVQLGAILLVFMLVWVGFLFVVAQGSPEKISSARSALIWTLIGGLILLGATAISEVIKATVNSIT